MLIKLNILLVVFFSFSKLYAQNDSLVKSQSRLKYLLISETVIITGSVLYLYHTWYKEHNTGNFHFYNDNNEWLLMDKIGHSTACYNATAINYSLMRWAGIEEKKALWYGAFSGLAFLTAVETMDGFSEGWGFSSGDMIANIAGTALFSFQQIGWNGQRIRMKWSFRQSPYAQYRPDLLGKNLFESAIKDYNGQTYWLSTNIRSLILKNSNFPAWLNLATGYGATGMTGARSNPDINRQPSGFHRSRVFYLSLDIDVSKIKTRSEFLKGLFSTINFIKIPFPTLEYISSENKLRGHILFF